MKKFLYIICVTLAVVLSGCGSKEGTEELKNTSIEEESMETISNVNADENIDLTKLNSTMLYARLTNIYDNPDSYIGSNIKIKGLFNTATSNTTNQIYYYAVIYDEVMCCQAGVEFIWDGNSHKYPEEYPEEGQEIQIEGIFSSYDEDGEKFYYLKINNIEIL